jgi:hypothetical protein
MGKKIIISTEQLTNRYSIPQVVAETLNEYEVKSPTSADQENSLLEI